MHICQQIHRVREGHFFCFPFKFACFWKVITCDNIILSGLFPKKKCTKEFCSWLRNTYCCCHQNLLLLTCRIQNQLLTYHQLDSQRIPAGLACPSSSHLGADSVPYSFTQWSLGFVVKRKEGHWLFSSRAWSKSDTMLGTCRRRTESWPCCDSRPCCCDLFLLATSLSAFS